MSETQSRPLLLPCCTCYTRKLLSITHDTVVKPCAKRREAKDTFSNCDKEKMLQFGWLTRSETDKRTLTGVHPFAPFRTFSGASIAFHPRAHFAIRPPPGAQLQLQLPFRAARRFSSRGLHLQPCGSRQSLRCSRPCSQSSPPLRSSRPMWHRQPNS